MDNQMKFFTERVQDFEQKVTELKSKFNDYSIYRVIIFVAFSVILIWLLNLKLLTPLLLTIAIFIVVFGLVVKRHNEIKRVIQLNQNLLEINKEEINRKRFDFSGIDDGQEFLDEHHEYSHDLDVFGRNSLFQLVNRAGTPRGRVLLASWLKRPSSIVEIRKRQEAVKELALMVTWRQEIQAYARTKSSVKNQEEAFLEWLSGKDMISSNRFYLLLPYLIMTFSSILIVGYFVGLLPVSAFLLPFVITGYFLYKIVHYSKETYEMTQTGVKHLESVKHIILAIEKARFSDQNLESLQQVLIQKQMMASEKINHLSKIFDWLSLRGNQMYWIFNSIFLLDFILLAKAEKWRKKFKNEIEHWFDAIAEFEALNSLAAFAFSNEMYTFPVLSNQTFTLRGKNIGHPLIPENSMVANDFNMNGQGTSCVITGSNMAGKSTFLRTIGTNAVLAFAGAPVCSDSLEISHFQVFSSMRTKDNLEENISSFYAELLRLKELLQKINDERPIFYLLDEILKGTNSTDRHIGAESLILQLNDMNAFGLVSTHDLELGRLAKKNEKIMNFNFSSSIIGEEIVFDYKLRSGICESTNASQLMAKIGIQIKSK